MLKRTFHNIFSLAMALAVLFSTLSFTVEKHFCGDSLIDVAIFSKVENCGMKMNQAPMNSIEKKHCCKDEVEIVKGQDKLKKTSFEDLNFDQQLFLSGFIESYINLFEGLPQQIIPHKDYSPPNLVSNIQVLDQVFII